MADTHRSIKDRLETRDRIVDAAYRTLVKSGYHQTSVKDIANAAGVAPGLVHYYFETKEDLLVAAIEYGCSSLESEWADRGLSLTGQFPLGASPVQLARLGLELSKSDLKKRLGLSLLVFDMYGVGLHNPKIAAAVNQFMQERRSLVEAIVRGVTAGMPEPPKTTPQAIAGAIYGALLGITFEKLIDRKFDADKAIDALAEMVFTFARLPVPPEGL